MLSIIQTTPALSLFPYTTLFRSAQAGVAQVAEDVLREQRRRDRVEDVQPHDRPDHPAGTQPPAEGEHRQVTDGRRHEDRKSTRLNSSHVKISYAVFCLRKKKSAA